MLRKQKRFLNQVIKGKSRYVAYVGGYGCGKSWIGTFAALMLSISTPNNRGLVGGPTAEHLRQTTRLTLFDHLDRLDIPYKFKAIDNEVTLPNGSTILVKSMDVPERVKSLNLGWFYIDEASDCPRDAWPMLASRLRLPHAKRHVGFVTSNPGAPWLHELARGGKWDFELIRASTFDNEYLPEGFAADLERGFGGADSPLARAFVHGEMISFAGLVYPMFDPDVHVKDIPVDSSWDFFAGIDFGYDHPFAYLLLARKGETTVVVAEHYARAQLLKHHEQAIRNLESSYACGQPVRRYRDHDAQDGAELHSLGIPTTNAAKDVMAGIFEVTRRLSVMGNGRPQLYVHPRCANLIAEFNTYEWAKSANDKPRKGDGKEGNRDDALDALRYAIASDARGPMVISSDTNEDLNELERMMDRYRNA